MAEFGIRPGATAAIDSHTPSGPEIVDPNSLVRAPGGQSVSVVRTTHSSNGGIVTTQRRIDGSRLQVIHPKVEVATASRKCTAVPAYGQFYVGFG